MKFFTLYSAKYKKTGFKSTAQEGATFHSTFISHTQIGGKLENNQTTVLTSDHWRRLQHTFRCFQTKTCHAAEKMEALRKGHVMFWMLSIKKRLLSRFVQNISYFVGMSDITTISNDWGNILQIWCKTSLEKKRVSLCRANTWIGTHATFPLIPKRCCRFSVVQSFQFEFATHLTYIQGKHSWSIYRKYNYRECWCYIIHIKRWFPRTNQWLFLHVLLICLQAKWRKSLSTWMSIFGGHFSALFQCVMTVSWNQPEPGCWNYLYYIFIHSYK